MYAWLLPHDMNTGSVKAYKIEPLEPTAALVVCNLVIRGAHCSLLWLASCSCFSSGKWILIIFVFFRQLGGLVNDCPSDIGGNIGLELYL